MASAAEAMITSRAMGCFTMPSPSDQVSRDSSVAVAGTERCQEMAFW
jgi:hypothetical protein